MKIITSSMTKLSVIIPAYNEEHRIGQTLLSVSQYLKKQSYNYEILVVIDGAKDKTNEIVEGLKSQVSNLKIFNNPQNHGKGYVVRQGMLAADGDVRLFMDADNSTKIDEVQKMIPLFDQGFNIVIGSRRIKGSVIAIHQPWFRDLLGGVFRLIVHTMVPMGVSDSQCGFKAFSGEAANIIFPRQTIYRWAFDVELLAIVRKYKLKIAEIAITWVNDTESHVKFTGMVNMLFEVFKVRLNLWTGKYK